MTDELKVARCRACRAEFTEAQLVGAKACPDCRTTLIPLDVAHDMTLRINWGDLRTLANWAERWLDVVVKDEEHLANDHRKSFEALLDNIRSQRPTGAPGLVLRDEVMDLQASGINAELVRETADGVETIVKKEISN